MKQKEVERIHAVKLQDDYIREQERKDEQRANEFKAREDRINNAMGKMAETVVKRNNKAEKEVERRVVQYAEERDRKAAEEDNRRKQAIRKRDQEVRKVLEQQLIEKNERKKAEQMKNKEYVDLVIARDEKDRRDMKDK
jgi:hypothetical protein